MPMTLSPSCTTVRSAREDACGTRSGPSPSARPWWKPTPTIPSTHIALATTLNNLGALLHRTSPDVLVRLRIFRRSAEHSRIAYERAPQVIRNGHWLITVLRNIAVVERQLGHLDEATAACREATAVAPASARGATRPSPA